MIHIYTYFHGQYACNIIGTLHRRAWTFKLKDALYKMSILMKCNIFHTNVLQFNCTIMSYKNNNEKTIIHLLRLTK